MGMVMHLGTKLVLEAARGDPDLQPAPDPFSRVHVLPWLGTRIHARLSRPAQERGHRLQVARRPLHAGLRAGRVSRLLDLARRRRRDDAPREGGHRSHDRSARATRIRARAGTGSSGSGSNPPPSSDQRDVARLCKGVAGMQRAGCIGGASLLLARYREPVDHARVCGRLSGSDALNCLRGVNVPGSPATATRSSACCGRARRSRSRPATGATGGSGAR